MFGGVREKYQKTRVIMIKKPNLNFFFEGGGEGDDIYINHVGERINDHPHLKSHQHVKPLLQIKKPKLFIGCFL